MSTLETLWASSGIPEGKEGYDPAIARGTELHRALLEPATSPKMIQLLSRTVVRQVRLTLSAKALPPLRRGTTKGKVASPEVAQLGEALVIAEKSANHGDAERLRAAIRAAESHLGPTKTFDNTDVLRRSAHLSDDFATSGGKTPGKRFSHRRAGVPNPDHAGATVDVQEFRADVLGGVLELLTMLSIASPVGRVTVAQAEEDLAQAEGTREVRRAESRLRSAQKQESWRRTLDERIVARVNGREVRLLSNLAFRRWAAREARRLTEQAMAGGRAEPAGTAEEVGGQVEDPTSVTNEVEKRAFLRKLDLRLAGCTPSERFALTGAMDGKTDAEMAKELRTERIHVAEYRTSAVSKVVVAAIRERGDSEVVRRKLVTNRNWMELAPVLDALVEGLSPRRYARRFCVARGEAERLFRDFGRWYTETYGVAALAA